MDETVDGSLLQEARRIAQKYCARRLACADDYGFPYDDQTACEDLFARSRATSPWQSVLPRCEHAIDYTSCAEIAAYPADCAGPPGLQEGERCDHWTQCVAGNYCDFSGGSCGRCAPERELDAECVFGSDCKSQRCQDGLCTARAMVGDDCQGDRDCEGFLCQEGTCADPAPLGSPCTRGAQCESGDCTGWVCVAYAIHKLGDPCDNDCSACRHGVCDNPGLDCVDGTCVESRGEGEACVASCRNGYLCLEGQCEALPEPGKGEENDACLANENCRSGLICNAARCSPAAKRGQPCLSRLLDNGGCSATTYCSRDGDQDTCVPRHEDGQHCDQGTQCLSGLCDGDAGCVPSWCQQR